MSGVGSWDDMSPIICKCQDCGKEFNKGTEGDNEKFCLRCERISFHERDIDLEGDGSMEPWDDNGDDGP